MEIIFIAVLILLNGVFSMSEIALVSSKKYKLVTKAKKGNVQAKKALELAENPNNFLSTVQVGITLIGILTGIFSGKKLTVQLSAWIADVPLLAAYANTMATVIVVIIITYFTIVFGELLPKRLGMKYPEAISSLVALPMSALSSVTKPLIWLLGKTTDFFLYLFNIKPNGKEVVTEEDIKEIVRQSTESGEIGKSENELVKRVFALGDRKARELMTYRGDVVWIDIHDSVAEIRQKIKRTRYSVYPVCEKGMDALMGVVSLKQLISHDYWLPNFDISKILEKPIYIYENTLAYKVLEQLSLSRHHSGVVIDEYGSIQGMITVNDVVDELIRQGLTPEEEDYHIEPRNDHSWLVDGRFPYYELLEYLHLQDDGEAIDFSTIGGLFIHLTKHIPKTGEKVNWKGFELEVVDMDGVKIDKVMVTRKDISHI
ncbi:hemolysin family protein [Olivibacter sitiensis]|uniref:hemolysin family protein n=1 Tax=Olivibacter sitiensis TaxID=376470 RepID=UPI000412D25D|nr:hemolysin family protein [Olivibacter sitiensis]